MSNRRADPPKPEASKDTRFKAGEYDARRNAGGRPKLPAWFKERGEDVLRHLLDLALGAAKDTRVSQGQACMEVVDRIYGKPTQAHEVETTGESLGAVIARRLLEVHPPTETKE